MHGSANPLCAFRNPNISPVPQGLPYRPQHLRMPRGCPAAGRKRAFLRWGKINAGSGCCQLGRTPRSTQMPLQASSVLPNSCCRCCGGAGDLGAEQAHPSCAKSKVRARKTPCMDFSQGVFPGQLSPFSLLINARGSGAGSKVPKPSQDAEWICPDIVPVMGQRGGVRWHGEKMSPKGLTAGQHHPKAESGGSGELLGQANPARVCDTGAEPRPPRRGLLRDKVTGGRGLKAAAPGHAGTDRGTDRELGCGRGRWSISCKLGL